MNFLITDSSRSVEVAYEHWPDLKLIPVMFHEQIMGYHTFNAYFFGEYEINPNWRDIQQTLVVCNVRCKGVTLFDLMTSRAEPQPVDFVERIFQ